MAKEKPIFDAKIERALYNRLKKNLIHNVDEIKEKPYISHYDFHDSLNTAWDNDWI